MDKGLFKKLYSQLNPEQKEAVDTIEGPVMVIAGPGTGKTQTLTLRIANILLNTQVNPENILALTFTENAVQEMRARLLEIIGTQAYRVSLYTFHALASEIIRENPESFERIIGRQPATDLDQMQIIERIIENGEYQLLKPFGDPTFYYKHVLSCIDQLKKDSVTPSVLQKALKREEENINNAPDRIHEKGAHKGKVKAKYKKAEKDLEKSTEFLNVYKMYEKSLTSQKLFDYNDMLIETITALQKNEDLLLSLQEKFQYFLIDEHQDTNTAQNKIVELLSSYFDNPNLFVVGDEKQAIFRFQGASLENFLYFKNLYPKAKLISLQINYRSTQEILDAATSIIKSNEKTTILTEVQLTAHKGKNKIAVNLAESQDYNSEYLFIAENIRKKIMNGTPPGEVAVLARTNADLPPLMRLLQTKGVEYTIDTDQNILDEIEIQKLITLFEAIATPDSDDKLIRALHIDFIKVSPLDIYRLRSVSKERKIPMWDMIAREIYLDEIDLETEEKVKEAHSKMLEWTTRSRNEPFDDVFVKVIKDSGLLQHILTKENSLELLEKITRLYDEIKLQIMKNPTFSLQDFLSLLDTVKTHNISLRKSATSRKNVVRLMTAHRAKGLEFDHIYIIAAYNGHWGNMRGRKSPINIPWHQLREFIKEIEVDENEDERRLFYVALTRARKECIISYARLGLDAREQLPSQFIEEIKPNLLGKIDTTQFVENATNGDIFALPKKKKKEDVFLTNKSFFRDMFIRQGLSVSGLNNYLECPWKYFFRNLLTLPDVKSQTLMFGTAIHYAINRYIIEKKKKKETDDKDLLHFFEHILSQLPLTEKEYNNLLKKGKEILPGYYENEIKHWNENNIDSELVIKGVKFADDVILTGRLDLIENTDDNSKVIVHDFKTGNPKSRNYISSDKYGPTRNYKRQLIFYKILLDRFHDKKLQMISGVIDFVQPNDSGKFKKEIFEITNEDVKELEELIEQVSKEILEISFWDKRCENVECEYCKLRSFMS